MHQKWHSYREFGIRDGERCLAKRSCDQRRKAEALMDWAKMVGNSSQTGSQHSWARSSLLYPGTCITLRSTSFEHSLSLLRPASTLYLSFLLLPSLSNDGHAILWISMTLCWPIPSPPHFSMTQVPCTANIQLLSALLLRLTTPTVQSSTHILTNTLPHRSIPESMAMSLLSKRASLVSEHERKVCIVSGLVSKMHISLLDAK